MRRGFTLIEVLVAISVIGVLVGVSTVAFNNAREKGADGRRKQDLAAIKASLELYFEQNGSYPFDTTNTSKLNFLSSEPNYSGAWIPNLVPDFIEKLPTDSKQTASVGEVAATTATQIFYDSFTGSMDLTSHTANTGQRWIEIYSSGARAVINGHVKPSAAAENAGYAYLADVTPATADYQVSMLVDFSGINRYRSYVLIRWDQATKSGYAWRFAKSGDDSPNNLYRITNGAITAVGSTCPAVPNSTPIILSAVGNKITAYKSGAEVCSLSDSTYTAPGKGGFAVGGFISATDDISDQAFDNFKIEVFETYTTPYTTPYGTPYGTPYTTPYTTPYGTPYGTPSYPTPSYPTPSYSTPSYSTPSTGTGVPFTYRYDVSADRKSFVLWATLQNTNDPEVGNCSGGPPEYNYCIRSD